MDEFFALSKNLRNKNLLPGIHNELYKSTRKIEKPPPSPQKIAENIKREFTKKKKK